MLPRHLGRPVDRAVVDDDDLEARVEGADLRDHLRDAPLLVERGNDREPPERREPRVALSHAWPPTPAIRCRRARAAAERDGRTCARRAPARARARPSSSACAGSREQLLVRRDRLVGALDDEELACPARTSARSRRADSRRSSRPPSRARTAATWTRAARSHAAARDVEVDARRGDRAREDVERHVADVARARRRRPGSRCRRARSRSSGSRRLGSTTIRSIQSRAELLAVAVEEDVGRLLDRQRPEELGVGAPEDRLGAARAELAQPLEPALRVRDDEVVLARIGAVVVVEARVHAAELGQAHRHVAVVEDDRDRRSAHEAPSATPRRWLIGTVKTTTASTSRSRSRIRSRWRCQRGVTQRQIVSRTSLSTAVSGGSSSARRMCVSPFSARDEVAAAGEQLALAVARVRLGPPPRRLARAGRGTASRSGRRRPRGAPSRAATRRACSRT